MPYAAERRQRASKRLDAELAFAEAAKGRHHRATAPDDIKTADYPEAVTLRTTARHGRRNVVLAFEHEHELTSFLVRNPRARKL